MAPKTTEKRANAGSATKVELDVCLGQVGVPVEKLVYVKDGPREFSQFAYQEEWLVNPVAFDISTDLPRVLGHPRFHVHFTPTSASWLNRVERWFADAHLALHSPRHAPLHARTRENHPAVPGHQQR